MIFIISLVMYCVNTFNVNEDNIPFLLELLLS